MQEGKEWNSDISDRAICVDMLQNIKKCSSERITKHLFENFCVSVLCRLETMVDNAAVELATWS